MEWRRQAAGPRLHGWGRGAGRASAALAARQLLPPACAHHQQQRTSLRQKLTVRVRATSIRSSWTVYRREATFGMKVCEAGK